MRTLLCLVYMYHIIEHLRFGHAQQGILRDSDMSVWMKLLKNASVDREHFQMKIPFSNISGLMWINISFSPKLSSFRNKKP